MKALLILLVVAAAAGTAFVYSGLYDISATDNHLPPTYYAKGDSGEDHATGPGVVRAGRHTRRRLVRTSTGEPTRPNQKGPKTAYSAEAASKRIS